MNVSCTQVLDICRFNLQRHLHMQNPRKHLFVMGGVGDEDEHVSY